MILHAPAEITPRLLPGVRVNGAFVSIEYSPRPGDRGRTRYRYHIDLPGHKGKYTGDDLQSGRQGGNLQEGLESLLCFLGAYGESVSYHERTESKGENADLFPAHIGEWCAENSDELTMLELELSEAPGAIQE